MSFYSNRILNANNAFYNDIQFNGNKSIIDKKPAEIK